MVKTLVHKNIEQISFINPSNECTIKGVIMQRPGQNTNTNTNTKHLTEKHQKKDYKKEDAAGLCGTGCGLVIVVA